MAVNIQIAKIGDREIHFLIQLKISSMHVELLNGAIELTLGQFASSEGSELGQTRKNCNQRLMLYSCKLCRSTSRDKRSGYKTFFHAQLN